MMGVKGKDEVNQGQEKWCGRAGHGKGSTFQISITVIIVIFIWVIPSLAINIDTRYLTKKIETDHNLQSSGLRSGLANGQQSLLVNLGS